MPPLKLQQALAWWRLVLPAGEQAAADFTQLDHKHVAAAKTALHVGQAFSCLANKLLATAGGQHPRVWVSSRLRRLQLCQLCQSKCRSATCITFIR